MKFKLEIEIEDDVTRRSLALNLRRVANGIERLDKGPFEEDDSAPIRDTEGNLVGEWKVVLV